MSNRLNKTIVVTMVDANRNRQIKIALPAESVYLANKLDGSTGNLDGVANPRSARDIRSARRGD